MAHGMHIHALLFPVSKGNFSDINLPVNFLEISVWLIGDG